MKILHCSDIHLGKRPLGGIGDFSKKRYEDYFNSFSKIADDAIEKKINVMLISGDFFDKKNISPEVLEKTEIILKKIHENNIKVLLIEGNHDNVIRGSESGSWIVYLENKELLKRLSYEITKIEDNKEYHFDKLTIDDINFYGVGYPGIMVDEIMDELSKKLDSNEKNVIMVHTAISANDFLPGTIKKETIDKFKDSAIYIAGGHFHSYSIYPKENPYFFIPGSSEYWNILNEKKQNKGYIIFDTETREHQFFNSETRNRIIMDIEIISDTQEDFKQEFKEKVSKLDININEDIVLIELKPVNNFYINIEECERVLTEQGALKAYISVKYPTLENIDFDNELISLDEAEKNLIKKEWIEFSGKYEETANFLKQLKEFQRDDEKDRFIENFDSMIEMIIGGDEVEDK